MFGKPAFVMHGKMFCGIIDDRLMVRVGPAQHAAALAAPHASPIDFTGKPIK